MNEDNRLTKSEQSSADYLAPLIFIIGLLIILYSTLKPFDFQFRYLTVSDYIAGYVLLPSSLIDFPRNIMLFMLPGFGLGAILDQRGWSKKRVRLAVLLCGLLLTITVESLQQFVTFRQPSLSDLIANTLGMMAGLACFRLWQNRKTISEWFSEAIAVPQKTVTALAIYVLLLLLMAYGLSTGAQLDGWDADYRMMIGNERTGNRIWLGSVGDLVIFNRILETGKARDLLKDPELALTNNDGLLAYYPLAGGTTQPDLTGYQPSMIWRSTAEIDSEGRTRKLDGDNWLETESAVSDLSERIQETSKFTIRFSVATAELEQIGPARIVSISEEPYLRNLTIGQQVNNLILRYRSPLTGENGTMPEIMFPNFFADSDPVDIAVTFDGLSFELIDSRSETVQVVEIVPGVAFYYRFLHPIVAFNPHSGQVPAGANYNWAYRLLFYIVVLLPVGILISPPVVKGWARRERIILILCSLFAIPLLLELVLVYRSGSSLRPINIVTSVLVIGMIAWVLVPLVQQIINLLRTAYAQRGS